MMDEQKLFDRLRACRVIPVIKLPRAELARPLGEALVRGGLPCVEITFRSDAAEEAIRQLSQVSGLLVGAGTVRSVAQVESARRAGAHFVVSPALREDVVLACRDQGIPVSPGVCTPSEVERALDLGVKVLKFFPAKPFGGAATLKAFGAVFPGVPFIPTGGIDEATLASYLALPNVLAVGGSWIADTASLAEERFDDIERRARSAVSLATDDSPA